MTILFLCHEHNLCKELWGYARAFRRRGVCLVCIEEGFPFNGSLDRLLQRCPERPSLILQPESDYPFLPWGLAEVDIPTACFQFDTFSYPRRRIRWSKLFDYPVVFHPGFEEQFRRAGNPMTLTLYHAAQRDLFDVPEQERVFEVGWVGRVNGTIYKTRHAVLRALQTEFRMNDWERQHTLEEMAEVYRRSKIVVNIGADYCPQDANMRVFEAMASGALLITQVPSELSAIGLEEGAHFVGFRDPAGVVGLVRHYLGDEAARCRIAAAGREKVLREHTYDCRVETILSRLEQDAGRVFAPARQWSEEQVRLLYLDFYAANLCLDCAYGELQQIARRSLRSALAGVSLIARAWARRSRGRLVAKVLRSS